MTEKNETSDFRREILKAIIRGLRFMASLLDKVLKGEPV
jgi:hypothetical protein